MAMRECTDKLILETILQDKFSYFKAEEGGVAVVTATDDNVEIRNNMIYDGISGKGTEKYEEEKSCNFIYYNNCYCVTA